MKSNIKDLSKFAWDQESQEDKGPDVSWRPTVGRTDGQINNTTRDRLEVDIRIPSWALPTLKDSSLRKSELNPNSPTQPSESASEFCSRRTEKKLQPSYQWTVVWTTWMKMTKSLSPDSEEKVTPSEIFQGSGSRSSQSKEFLCWQFGLEKRKRNEP